MPRLRTPVAVLAALTTIATVLLGVTSASADSGKGSAWAITIQPIEPEVHQTIVIRATAFGPGGIPKYVIHLDDTDPPVLRLDSPASMTANQLGVEVSWELEALRAGRQDIWVTVDYEKQVCTDPEDPKTCHYQFFYEESSPVTLVVPTDLGDANCDGEVDSLDASIILQYVAGLIENVPCPDTADVDGDGDVDAVDSLVILQYVAGIIPDFP